MSTAQDTIKSTIENNAVVLFMKGTPVFPQCGFSCTRRPLSKFCHTYNVVMLIHSLDLISI